MDAAEDIACYVAQTKFNDLPEDVVIVTKKCLLDALALSLAGSSASGISDLVEGVRKWGGKGDSSILVFGDKVPCTTAALVNSAMCHAREMDDTHDKAIIHSCAPIIPAALAVSEQYGGVSGKRLITAVALGIDITCRLGLAADSYTGWHYTAICGTFGAAMASSKILGFNRDKTFKALGLAYSQTAGNKQCVLDGGLVKRFQPGFAARNGVLAAFMADKDISSSIQIFEGQYGFFKMYYDGKWNRKRLLNDLGKTFEGVNLSFKNYPSCRHTHGPIEAAIQIVSKNNLDYRSVQKIVVHVPNLKRYAMEARPFQERGNLQVDAQFSIPYTVAAGVIRRDLSFRDLEEPALSDPLVKELAKKVDTQLDIEVSDDKAILPVKVEITMQDGLVYSETLNTIKGTPGNHLTSDELKVKLSKCADLCVKRISQNKIGQLIELIENLEKLPIATDILQPLTSL